MTSIRGKLFAVTGAASGIGNATARLLASHGAILTLADLHLKPLDALAEELRKDGVEVITRAVNITKRDQVEKWIEDTVKQVGKPLDGAANLAGVVGASVGTPPGAVRNVSDDEYDAVMTVNGKGTLNCVRAQLNNIKEGKDGRGGGSIVNAASLAGKPAPPGSCLMGFTENTAYCASKHAIIAITQCAAKEEGLKGIRINAIAPGIIQTPMMDDIDRIMGKHYGDPGAMARRGTPLEVANLVLFLLSDESSFITGMTYPIDGGWHC